MPGTGKKRQVRFSHLGRISPAHRLAIVPAAEMSKYLDPRLGFRKRFEVGGDCLVILEQDLSGEGSEFVLHELLQSPCDKALEQAMREGVQIEVSPVIEKAVSKGMATIA